MVLRNSLEKQSCFFCLKLKGFCDLNIKDMWPYQTHASTQHRHIMTNTQSVAERNVQDYLHIRLFCVGILLAWSFKLFGKKFPLVGEPCLPMQQGYACPDLTWSDLICTKTLNSSLNDIHISVLGHIHCIKLGVWNAVNNESFVFWARSCQTVLILYNV